MEDICEVCNNRYTYMEPHKHGYTIGDKLYILKITKRYSLYGEFSWEIEIDDKYKYHVLSTHHNGAIDSAIESYQRDMR